MIQLRSAARLINHSDSQLGMDNRHKKSFCFFAFHCSRMSEIRRAFLGCSGKRQGSLIDVNSCLRVKFDEKLYQFNFAIPV